MLYASCKASFVAALSNFGLKSDEFLSIEIDGPSEVSEEALISQLHPDLTPTKKVKILANDTENIRANFHCIFI